MMCVFFSVRSLLSVTGLCILMFIACPPTYAQSDDAPDIEGRWVLQFRVTENFTLGTFNGALTSAKKQWSERRAFRFGVSGGHRARR